MSDLSSFEFESESACSVAGNVDNCYIDTFDLGKTMIKS